MANELIVNEKEKKKEKRKLFRDIVFIILFGLLIIWFTGSFLANRNNIDNHDNDIKTELVSRSDKIMKQAYRNKVDTICFELYGLNTNNNIIVLRYPLCDEYILLNDYNYAHLYNNLYLTYSLSSNLFTECEFEIEFYDDYSEFYLLTYAYPEGYLDYLNTTNDIGMFDTFYSEGSVHLLYEGFGFEIDLDYPVDFGDYDTYIPDFGSYFDTGYFISELNNIKTLVNSKLEQGYGSGYEVGSEEGYEEGYTDGYDVGLDEGYYDGFDFGYETGINEGLADGYREGYDNGLEDGYSEGVNVGYQEGYEVGITDLQKENLATTGFKTLFNAILNAPYNIFKGILNFEFLGINLFSLFSFIFTTMLILWIVKIFKK